jgi:hypothetical protein
MAGFEPLISGSVVECSTTVLRGLADRLYTLDLAFALEFLIRLIIKKLVSPYNGTACVDKSKTHLLIKILIHI